MTASELKRMRRSDLLEMRLQLRKENDRLSQELEQTRQALSSRAIFIEQCGSLAEAVVKLNGLMEATQQACDQYTYNVKNAAKKLRLGAGCWNALRNKSVTRCSAGQPSGQNNPHTFRT